MQHMQDTTIHITVYYNTVKPSINFHKGSNMDQDYLFPDAGLIGWYQVCWF